MADAHYSSSKSVPQSTAPPTYTAPRNEVSLDAGYFRTGPGMVKLVELLLGIIIMACTAPAWNSGTHWFLFVVVTAFVATLLWCFIYLLNLRSAITLPIDWLLTELLNTGITTLLYLIAVIVQFCYIEKDPESIHYSDPGRNIAGGIFGIFNTLTYTAGSFFLYRDWKNSHPNADFSRPAGKGQI